MISKSRRDSVGGGSSRIVPCSPKADAIQWGGGSSRTFFRVLRDKTTFRYLQLRNHIFTPHRVIFVGRDTHFWLDTPEIRISCWSGKTKNHSNCPHSVRFWNISVRPGDQE